MALYSHCGSAAPHSGGARHDGFTLIELLISLVIFAAALVGVLGAYITFASHSADPMIRAQALSVGQAYLDEILLKDFVDPDGVGPEARANFDDIGDYDGLGEAPTDQFGNPIGGLTDYSVNVSVGASALGANLRRILVRVSHPGGVDLALAAHRANY